MLDRFTSTWAILLFLLGAMIVASFVPSNNTSTASEGQLPQIGLEGDILNQELSATGAAGTTSQFAQTN